MVEELPCRLLRPSVFGFYPCPSANALNTALRLGASPLEAGAWEPEKRAATLGQLVGQFAQLRREESNATRAQVTRERWDAVKPRPLDDDRIDLDTPKRAYLLHKLYIEKYSNPENHPDYRATHPTRSE